MRSPDEILVEYRTRTFCPKCEAQSSFHHSQYKEKPRPCSCCGGHPVNRFDDTAMSARLVFVERVLDALRTPSDATLMAMRDVYATGSTVMRVANLEAPSSKTLSRLTKMLTAALEQAEREATS